MRKLFMLVILGLVAAFGVNAATASAANCTFSQDNITRYVSGGSQVMAYNAHIKNCSGVSAVRWVYANSGFEDCTEGSATGACYIHQAYLNGTTFNQEYANPGSADHYAAVAQTCWYGGIHSLKVGWYYQIKNAATNTWGPLGTSYTTFVQGITC